MYMASMCCMQRLGAHTVHMWSQLYACGTHWSTQQRVSVEVCKTLCSPFSEI